MSSPIIFLLFVLIKNYDYFKMNKLSLKLIQKNTNQYDFSNTRFKYNLITIIWLNKVRTFSVSLYLLHLILMQFMCYFDHLYID